MTPRYATCTDRTPLDLDTLRAEWERVKASRAATRRRRARARARRAEARARAYFANAWNALALSENWSTLD